MAEVVHHCCCPDCKCCPQGTFAEEHRLINQLVATFDEKSRRLYVAFLARQQGRGGIAKLARITGLSRNTIRRGQGELLRPSPDLENRIRHKGGGRQRLEKKRHGPPDRTGKTDAGCHGRRSDEGVEVDA
jgi:hypothetical protein